MQGCVVGQFAAAQVFYRNGRYSLLNQIRMFIDNAANRWHPRGREMASGEDKNERSPALVLGNLPKIFSKRENAESSVFLNRVGAAGMGVNNDHFVR